MFMLPVSEAEALNIVVSSPCWKYGKTDMLLFKYLSMAFRKSEKPGQDVYQVFGEESKKNELYCCCRFVLSWQTVFCVRMPYRLIVFNEFGFVLQLGKIVASIEQKPVSLNDICDVQNSYQE